MPVMDIVPIEVLCIISQHLDATDLSAFSLASKKHELAARTHLFHTIKLTLASPGDIDHHIALWLDLLRNRDSFRHVRRLEITDRAKDGIDIVEPCCHDKFSPKDNRDYTSLLKLYRSLPALQDLVWGCAQQLPPCVLQALRDIGFNCRLHLETFRLCSLERILGRPSTVDEYEWALATSPCLYRISVCCCKTGHCQSKCNMNSLLSLVQWHAPNLKEVCVSDECYHIVSGPDRYPQKLPWPNGSPLAQAALTSLDLFSWAGGASRAHAQEWSRTTRFSKLVEFACREFPDEHILQYLTQLDWSSLRRLRLRYPPTKYVSLWNTLHPYYKAFLSTLIGLRDLELSGGLKWTAVIPVIECLGGTLRRLSVSSLMAEDPGDLQRLKRSCSRLAELSIAMSRTEGDSREFEIYSTLGEFRNLQHLELLVDCSITSSTDTARLADRGDTATLPPCLAILEGSETLHSLDRATIMAISRAWTNSNVDEDIAAGIFQTITDSKPTFSTPLQTMELRLRQEGEIKGLDFDIAKKLIMMLSPEEPLRGTGYTRRRVVGVSWHCRRRVTGDVSGCIVSKLEEDEHDKSQTIGDSSPRGIDIRPLILLPPNVGHARGEERQDERGA